MISVSERASSEISGGAAGAAAVSGLAGVAAAGGLVAWASARMGGASAVERPAMPIVARKRRRSGAGGCCGCDMRTSGGGADRGTGLRCQVARGYPRDRAASTGTSSDPWPARSTGVRALPLQQVPQHGLEDAAVPVVIQLDRSAEARERGDDQGR